MSYLINPTTQFNILVVAGVALRLSSWEMYLATRIQILDEAVCVSLRANALRKA